MKYAAPTRCRFALLLAALMLSGAVYADDAAVPAPAPAPSPPPAAVNAAAAAPSRHRLMKDCMTKEKAAESGKPKYELSDDCKDITKTEKQNVDAEKKDAEKKQADKAAADKPA